MITKRIEEYYNEIKKTCWKLIKEKHVDISELAYRMGMSSEKLLSYFENNSKDLSIYLTAYSLLTDWGDNCEA